MSNKSDDVSLWDKIPLIQKLKSIKHFEFILIGIFVAVLGVIYLSSKPTNSQKNNESTSFDLQVYTSSIEKRLESVIGDISGVGRVSVMVTLDGGMSYEYAKESEEVTTTSSVSGGSNSKTTVNESVVIVTQNGKNTPLIVREIYPNVSGVLVVCSGAGNVAVKLNIINAVSTLLGVSENKIEVLPGNK